MAEQIKLHSFRKEVDSTYVGFTPNGGSIKPVHVANGVQRCIFGGFNTAMQIKRLALVSDAKGNVPTGSELETIYAELAKNEAIEDGIAEGSVESMRNVMQRLLSADKGVYVVKGLKDDMISFTAGSKYFLTRSSIYEDTGEFIGGLIHSYCPELAEYIKRLLDEAEDPISLLFEPVSESSLQIFEKSRHEDLPAFKSQNEAVKWYLKGLNESGLCLMDNLKRHPNPLTQLRLFNFFCIFHLVRYMALLEAFYCGENIRPVLLDFSGIAPSQSSVARASEMAYTQMHKSINRFYAWGYAQKLKEKDLLFPLGRTPNGKDLIEDLSQMPHMLVGGSTGSGKSVFLFSMLAALLMTHPEKEDMQLILSSSKLEDFIHFEGLPHLYSGRIISDATEATKVIKEVIFEESERRGRLLAEARVANIVEYNKKVAEKLAPIVVVIDEFADLADQLETTKEKNAFYKPVQRIAQAGRSRGIHLVICTQRPEAKLVPSTTKAQLNGRVALRVNDGISSRMIIEEPDAQYLQKHGDMIYRNGDIIERAQGYLIEIEELDKIVDDVIHGRI